MEKNNNTVTEKKKIGKGKIIGGVVIAALIILGIGVWYSGAVMGISKDEARQIALNQVPGSDAAESVLVNEEFDDMQKTYDVSFTFEGVMYEFEISARNGEVISQESEQVFVPQQEQGSTGQLNGEDNADDAESTQGTDIGIEKAKKIALGKVSGAAESDIVKAEMDREDGILVYEVEIKYDSMEYDFTINGATGVIVERSSESVYD
ncbi:MAG: PepSY domain-containing protein [Emergencia sp.]|nr:PepSY domain-containing protein [Emergencia sp.]